MEREDFLVPPGELERQRGFMAAVREVNRALPEAPLALVDTYGCQQNEADSERLRGMLGEMGYAFTQDKRAADVIVINTCAVREHAEMRILGNVGALTHTKRAKPSQIIALCGCMVQQSLMAERIRKSFPIVDMVFGPDMLWKFPEFLHTRKNGGKRVFSTEPTRGSIAEGLPVCRIGGVKAWVSVMYGCNNFCTYCIVPYVRGRERSRDPELVLEEIRSLVKEGVKDITLLGQNVNSYGGGGAVGFPELLRLAGQLDGDFLLRFMTSHPKDATGRLFDAMAESPKIARHLHLPVQAGSDGVLRAMNRGYTARDYLRLTEDARRKLPGLVLTSDVIVGFPGETDEAFEDTLRLVEEARFDALFTFLYSPRPGTPAARLPDPYSRQRKQERFDRLLTLQNRISGEKHAEYVGKTLRVLIDGEAEGREYGLSARTNGGRLVHLRGDRSLVGGFHRAEITGSSTWALFGTALP